MICVVCATTPANWECTVCAKALCSSCKSDHRQQFPMHTLLENDNVLLDHQPPVAKKSKVKPETSDNSRSLMCAEHPDQPLNLYCGNCRHFLCIQCPHAASHVVISAKDACTQQQKMQDKLKDQLTDLCETLQHINLAEADLQQNAVSISQQVQQCFAQLLNAINQRQQQLESTLAANKQHHHDRLKTKQAELQAMIADLEEQCKLLRMGRLDILPNLMIKIERLTNYNSLQQAEDKKTGAIAELCEPLVFHPAYVSALNELISKVGMLVPQSQVATEATLHGEGVKYCCVNRKTTITLQTKNKNQEIIRLDSSDISGEIWSRYKDKKVCLVNVNEWRHGNYVLSYTVPKEGSFKLVVRLYGQPIQGSPFNLRCMSERHFYGSDSCSIHSRSHRSPAKSSGTKRSTPIEEDDLVLKVGMQGRGWGEFINPQGLCVLPDGSVAIADSNNQCVQIFNDTDCIHRFGGRGRAPGNLQRPIGVAVYRQKNLLVSDYDNKWVCVFDQHGVYKTRFGAGKLLGPKGIKVNSSNQIVVVDNKASCVLIFTEDGRLQKKFGSRGVQPDKHFAGPHYLAISPNSDRMYITDFHNHAVKVYTNSGEYLFAFGSNGEGLGQFNAPTGIATDDEGNVLVADWGNNRIQVFDANGSFLSFVNTNWDSIYGPQGLDVALAQGLRPFRHAIVSDSGNHCFKIYKYLT